MLPRKNIYLSSLVRCEKFEEKDGLIIEYLGKPNVNSVALFFCRDREKSLNGSRYQTCLSNGQWSGEPPNCIFLNCKKFEESNDLMIEYDDDKQKINSHAMLTCRDKKKSLEGLMTRRTCLENGQWSGQTPKCIYARCSTLKGNEFVEITYNKGLDIGSVASFYCNGNYFRLNCLQNGTWSGKVPTCRAPTCSMKKLREQLPENMILDMEERRSAMFPTFPYKYKIALTCSGRKRSSAPADAVCGINGNWKIPSVGCVSGCDPLVKTAGDQLIVEPEKEYYKFGDQVTLSCGSGKVLSSDVQVMMCLADGWSETKIPYCIRDI